MREYELQRSTHKSAPRSVCARLCVCVCVCVCVCLGGRGGVFMRALLWHMRVQSCLITDQALRQRQTVL